jgi:hypothetical protein
MSAIPFSRPVMLVTKGEAHGVTRMIDTVQAAEAHLAVTHADDGSMDLIEFHTATRTLETARLAPSPATIAVARQAFVALAIRSGQQIHTA